MIYSLLVYSAPSNITLSQTALEFARALLRKNHQIYRIFFYGDGVALGNHNTVAAQDEMDIAAAWRTFIQQNKLDAVICITAALKRGLLSQTECARYQKSAVNIDIPYDLSGLGQLIEAAVRSDKLITFA